MTMMNDDADQDKPLTAIPVYEEKVDKKTETRNNQVTTNKDAETIK